MSVATSPDHAESREAARPAATPWRRLLWKEFRTYQSFFIVLLAFGLFLQLLGQFWQGWEFLSLLMAMMYLAGVIGTGFSREHEAGTYLWLRAQPLTAQQIIGSKLLAGAVGAALLTIIFSAMLMLRHGQFQLTAKMTCDLAVVVLELTGWSLLMSVTDRQPLRALVLAGCFAATIGFGLLLGVEAAFGIEAPRRWSLTWLRFGIASIVMLTALRLSFRWHKHGLTGSGLWGLHGRQTLRQVTLRPQPGPVRALIRLTIRQSWWLVFPAALVAISLRREAAITSSLTTLSGVCGLLTFTALGRERVQLAIHGASPKMVWLVRVGVLAAPLVIALALLGILREVFLRQVTWTEVASIVVVVFFATQLVSIGSSSSLMALGMALPATILGGLFVNFCWHGAVPITVLVLPFVALSSFASLFIVHRWLLGWDDRRTNRLHRMAAWGAVLLWLAGIATYRWLEYPQPSPEQLAEAPTFTSIDQTLWRQQRDNLLKLGKAGEWAAFATAADDAQVLPDPAACEADESRSHAIHQLFDNGMNRSISSETARDLLRAQIHWSRQDLFEYGPYRNLLEFAYSERTSVEDLAALRDDLIDHPPRTDTALKQIGWNRTMLHRIAKLDPDALGYIGIIQTEATTIRVIGALAFWERWRFARQVDQNALAQTRRTHKMAQLINNHMPITRDVRTWTDTSRLIAMAGVAPELSYAFHVREHRANVLRLEAIMHFREHGEFPTSIDSLTHGAHRDFIDPFTAKPYTLDTSGDHPLLISPTSNIGPTGHDYQLPLKNIY